MANQQEQMNAAIQDSIPKQVEMEGKLTGLQTTLALVTEQGRYWNNGGGQATRRAAGGNDTDSGVQGD